MTTHLLPHDEAREARIAARVAARADRPTPTGPRTAPSWRAMLTLVRTHAGLNPLNAFALSDKAFAEALWTAGVGPEQWNTIGYLDQQAAIDAECETVADALIAAGYRITQGPRGGLRFERRG